MLINANDMQVSRIAAHAKTCMRLTRSVILAAVLLSAYASKPEVDYSNALNKAPEPIVKPIRLAGSSELAYYRHRITGAEYPVVVEEAEFVSGAVILVGATSRFAKRFPAIDLGRLTPDSTVLKVADGDLFLAGQGTSL